MKRYIAAMAAVLVAVLARAGEYRTFTDAEGRTLEAQIESFDARSGKIKLERQDGKHFSVSPAVFSEDDQAYIERWIAADRMLSDSNLRFTYQKHTRPVDRKVEENRIGFNGEAVQFEVTVENRSTQPIDHLNIAYRYYISVAYKSYNRKKRIYQVAGEPVSLNIPASSSVTFSTKPVTFGEEIRTVHMMSTSGGDMGTEERTYWEEDLEGVWLKIHGPEIEGEAVVRDECYPDNLDRKLEWNEGLVTNREAILRARAEKIKENGEVENHNELTLLVFNELMQLEEETDEARIRVIDETLKQLYDEKYDASVGIATAIAAGFYHKGLYDRSIRWLDEYEGSYNNLFRLCLLTELYATAPAVSDGAKAVRYARKLEGHPSYRDTPWMIHLLASAYARNGQFEKAVAAENDAIAKLSSGYIQRYQVFFERCLALYKAGTPYELDKTDPCCWHLYIQLTGNPIGNAYNGPVDTGDMELWDDKKTDKDGRTISYFFRSGFGMQFSPGDED